MGYRLSDPKRFGLARTSKQRWHLWRTQMTQLVTHERIHTTWAKARALQFLAHKTFKLGQDASKNRGNAINRLMGILTTRFAIKKLINEIVPKFKDPKEQVFKVVEINRRKSDFARMGYIEFNKNEIAKYEESQQKQLEEQGKIVDISKYNKSWLTEERDFIKEKLDQAQSRFDALQADPNTPSIELKRGDQDVKFFKRKLETVEKDLWIENKNPLDMRRYFRIY
ncbi:unnamed protein product [Paramecium sonneborni]|uniref:Ribosomal protein L17 n=1 Tax=Paramecium sonneborni TaxID=65129 RepID=A0A8S1KXA7_9CILI|nr:unnamed protein product [Paramecium sonneborni]